MNVEEAWPDVIDINGVRVRTFKWILDNQFRDAGSLLDLGSGPCVFARHARDAGFGVTAVDVRTERLPKDKEMEGIRFVEEDVRVFDVSGFDVISNLGLLYHLSLEDQWDLLHRSSYASVIIETQVHFPDIVPKAARPWGYEIVKEGPYEGVLYPEGDNAMAGSGNERSFWHTERSLMRLFEDTGYRSVMSVEPLFVSKYGARKFYVLEGGR